MRVDELFYLHQGNGFELYNMSQSPDSSISFVSRTAQANGVVGKVDQINGVAPFPAGYITVALGGSVLSSFVQKDPFYTAFHIMVLEPKRDMTFQEKLFYCMCIQNNAYRYSYGRQANRTLKDIEIPDEAPEWVNETSVKPISTSNSSSLSSLEYKRFKEFLLSDIFEIKYGINLELLNCVATTNNDPTAVNFVARTSQNNGVVAKVKPLQGIEPQPAGVLTCAGGGSVLSTFVQNSPFYSGRDLYLLIPKFSMSTRAKLFCCTVIEANKYRFSYGRQANKTLPSLPIKLPAKNDGTPDFEYMDTYIRQLPYGDKI